MTRRFDAIVIGTGQAGPALAARLSAAGWTVAVIDAETKLILGAAILGPEGDEIIHSILDAMYAKAPYTMIQRAMHIHPTVSELIPTMLADLKSLG